MRGGIHGDVVLNVLMLLKRAQQLERLPDKLAEDLLRARRDDDPDCSAYNDRERSVKASVNTHNRCMSQRDLRGDEL